MRIGKLSVNTYKLPWYRLNVTKIKKAIILDLGNTSVWIVWGKL